MKKLDVRLVWGCDLYNLALPIQIQYRPQRVVPGDPLAQRAAIELRILCIFVCFGWWLP